MIPKDVHDVISKSVDDPLQFPPVLMTGQPGIGKSAIPRQLAEEKGIGFVDMRLAQRDPTDLRGIPAVVDIACPDCRPKKGIIPTCPSCNGTGKVSVARWLPPPELPTSGRGILMLDEITSCPPLTQASAYQLTLDRKIGEYNLPEGYYIVAAGNRLEDRAVVYRMSTALANRFWHIDFEVSLDNWTEWALKHQINANIVGFLQWRPDLLAPEFDPNSSEKAFPTPRTWEFASKNLHLTKKYGLLAAILEGTIGKGATGEFMAFIKLQTELPDLAKILSGENDFVPKKTDLRYALISALVTKASTPKQINRLIEYSELFPEEFGILLVTMLVSKVGKSAVALAPAMEKWTQNHISVIRSWD